jgi:hypothetical protein
MRKRIRLLLTLAFLLVATGVTGLWKALAAPPCFHCQLPFVPSSGTPTALSLYGTITLSTAFTATGNGAYESLDIFSTSGPFYVEKVYVMVEYAASLQPINLFAVSYDSRTVWDVLYPCPVIIPAQAPPVGFGDITLPVPFTMIDQTGARAIPAAGGLEFTLVYNNNCIAHAVYFPSGVVLSYEATILAPTAATVSICASEFVDISSCSEI